MRQTASLLVLALLIGATSHAVIHVLPPAPLPIGWELDPIPGFEPYLELGLENAFTFSGDGSRQPYTADNMAAWGAKAIPILMGLYEDERWKEYRATIIAHLACDTSESTAAWANSHIQAMVGQGCATGNPSEERLRSLRDMSAAFLDRINADTAVATRDALLKCWSGDFSQEWTSLLCSILREFDPDALADLLEDLGKAGPEAMREQCVYELLCLRTEESYLAAIRLGDETGSGETRARLVAFITVNMGSARAQEPLREGNSAPHMEGGAK